MFDLNTLIRENIKALQPYSSARSEYSGQGSVWLDANENPFETVLNRYPDPKQIQLKRVLAAQKNIDLEHIFIGNGSDEIIDLLFRAFCNPQEDKAYVFTPTYGMYKVSAAINNVELIDLKLNEQFQLPALENIKCKVNSKGLLFICSPNNPTGNSFDLQDIKSIADQFNGLLIVDEAYIDFSESRSAIELLESTPNVVVLQTLSKAYGLAGLRLGMAYASKAIVEVLNKIKPPYNVNTYSQTKSVEVLGNYPNILNQIEVIKEEREKLSEQLEHFHFVIAVHPSQANFILVEFTKANLVYNFLKKQGIIVRNRTSEIRNCLRISVGTPYQNTQLINTLKTFKL